MCSRDDSLTQELCLGHKSPLAKCLKSQSENGSDATPLLMEKEETAKASMLGSGGSSLDKNCSPDMHVVRLLSIYRSHSRKFLELDV